MVLSDGTLPRHGRRRGRPRDIWRFSAVVGQNVGGAYLIPYLLAAFCCTPLLVLELSVGRSLRTESELQSEEGATFEQTVEEAGNVRYYCNPTGRTACSAASPSSKRGPAVLFASLLQGLPDRAARALPGRTGVRTLRIDRRWVPMSRMIDQPKSASSILRRSVRAY